LHKGIGNGIGIVHGSGPWDNHIGKTRASVWSMNVATKGIELENRFISFAAQIVTLSSKLPSTLQSRHICRQILRSGTATAANYGEARGAESHADFIHKLGVVLKELNETVIWLELIEKTSLLPAEELLPVVVENRELAKIITASIKTARRSSGRSSM
jgi:four helix bundle protein